MFVLFTANSMTVIAPLTTFIVFILLEKSTGRELNTATAYTTLSLLALLSNPINTLLRTIPMLVSALACFDRIQSYLESNSRQRHALPLNSLSTSNASHSPTNNNMEIELESFSLPRQSFSNATMIQVRNASFAWNLDKSPAIDDVSFSILRKSFSFIVGPIGCGKSTLLKGLMSETPSSKGFVYSDSSDIAFVAQTCWIQNTTVRQNIIGQSIFDDSWYNEVIVTCALDHDIASLPSKDGMFPASLFEIT